MLALDSNPATQAQAQPSGWFDDDWAYRRPVTISNPCGQEKTDFQVQVALDSSFDFAKAEPDGSDVRFTDEDGQTKIPFWIEEWDQAAQTARIWVKMPILPTAGRTIYLYYGNPNPPGPDLLEVPPLGPWDKRLENPIVPIGDPGNGDSLLAENMVYDPGTDHYWLAFANYRDGSVGLIWSDDAGDPTTWHWHGSAVNSANSPHLLEYEGTWYIFYSDRGHGGPPYPISVSTSDVVSGTYAYAGTVLTSTEAWEAYRVDEPYLFQRPNGRWILVYMGDAGNTTEQIGYAEAQEILGPYTKFPGNPCIPLGAPGSIDGGTAADAWVVRFGGAYYIGYTVSPTKSHPWRTSYVTTNNWTSFTKSNEIILDLGLPGEWDEANAFRGAVTRFGDMYYFPYTGSTADPYVYRMGLATQPAFMAVPLNDPQEVFEFYDGFDGETLDSRRWSVNYQGTGGAIDVGGGVITMTGQSGIASGYVQMWGAPYLGTGTLLEVYARHLDAGLNAGENPSFPGETNTAGEVGYKASDFANVIRMMDFPDMQKYTIQATSPLSTSGYVDTAVDFDTDWHTYDIYRTAAGTAEYQIDDNSAEVLGPPYVPTSTIRPWLMSYARVPAPRSRFEIDWIRVRQYCGTEPDVVLGSEQELSIVIAKTPDIQTVPSGSDVIFSIAVTNTSGVDLSDVHVVDQLIPECNGTFASLAPGASASYTCTLPGVTSDLVNTATVTGTASATVYVSDTDTAFVDVLPAIAVEKEALPNEVREPGGTVTFTVAVTNHSAEPFELTSLTDSIHGNLHEQGTCSMPQVLAVDAVYLCSFPATVSGQAGYLETDEVTAAGGDDDGNFVQASDVATVTITAIPAIVITPTALTVSEPHTSAAFTLTLTTQPTASVSIGLSPSNGECSVAPSSVTLDSGNWVSGTSVTVTAVDDDIDDDAQICIVQTGPATSTDPNYHNLNPVDVTVTVLDDDEKGIAVAPLALTIREPDGSDTFSLTLRSQPTASVTIPLTATNDECSVAPSSVILDSDNWASGLRATVTAVDDDVTDGDQICVVQTGPAGSGDGNYNGLNPEDVIVVVQDNDIRVRLPFIIRNWPPIPDAPILHPISNPGGVGTYTATWTVVSQATTYVLEEAKDDTFSHAQEIYVGPSTSYAISNRGAASYYYRAKARNMWADGIWSNVQPVTVLWEAEPNDDGLSQANGPIPCDQTYFGTFLTTADVNDYFYFDLSASCSVELWLTNIPTGHNYDLILLDASLALLGYSGELRNNPEHIRRSNLPQGRYYIRVFHRKGAGSTQPYHLQFACQCEE
jgi:uncharacterized repeat protein (TIGR01451 family)